jgi:hypothetical protein
MTVSIELPWLGSPTDELWEVLLRIAEKSRKRRVPWMLIGGQMMLLHTLEHGRQPLQISQDGDALADIRAQPAALRTLVAILEQEDFGPDGSSGDGRAHRYRHKTLDPAVLVDVLAPDNMGARANLTTTPPGRTVEVPGGTQSLHRRELVDVALASGHRGRVPRPDLLGAMVIKAAATTLPERRERHVNDLALLCSLVVDPFAIRERMDDSDRRWLRRAGALADPAHPSWTLIEPAYRNDGQQALQILLRDKS